jgi:hypothetical protein
LTLGLASRICARRHTLENPLASWQSNVYHQPAPNGFCGSIAEFSYRAPL